MPADFYSNVGRVFSDWNYGHPIVLYGLIRSMKPDVIVEVGTYRGFGAAWMAKAVQENNKGRVYCIDNFSLTDHESRVGSDARTHLNRNLEALGVKEWTTLIDGDSDKIEWPRQIDFAYIDGWHGYTAVHRDFENCVERGAELIAFDDTTQSVGPRKLIQQIRELPDWDVLEVLRDCGMAICMRKKQKGPITFSQELPLSLTTGVDLQTLTTQGQMDHLKAASKLNGIEYDDILKFICNGK